jgi:hypothetical protein
MHRDGFRTAFVPQTCHARAAGHVIEPSGELLVERWEQVPICVESRCDRRMAETFRDRLGMRSRLDRQRGRRMPQVVEAKRLQVGSANCRKEDPVPEVRASNRSPFQVGKDQAIGPRRKRRDMSSPSSARCNCFGREYRRIHGALAPPAR